MRSDMGKESVMNEVVKGAVAEVREALKFMSPENYVAVVEGALQKIEGGSEQSRSAASKPFALSEDEDTMTKASMRTLPPKAVSKTHK